MSFGQFGTCFGQFGASGAGALNRFFVVWEPVDGWLREFNPNTDTLGDSFDLLATMIHDDQVGASETYTITEPSDGWLRTFDSETATMEQYFDALATLATEFTGTENVYTATAYKTRRTINTKNTTFENAMDVLATFMLYLKAEETIG